MDVIRRTGLERLALQGGRPCVSVFLPTHRAGPEAQQGPIRLKNLLRQATEALKADGVRTPEIDRLLPLLTGDGHFFVLALSQHQVRLRRGGPKQLQLHVADRGGVGARAIFHGHRGTGDVQEERVLRYLREVDRALGEVLAGEQAPMVLPAVEHLAPLWRQATTYPHLVDELLPGNPEALGAHELHPRTWAMVEPRFLQAHREAAARYHRLAGTGLTSQDPQVIVRAAKEAASRPCSPPSIRPARAPMGRRPGQ